jgi:PhnB protein
VLLDTEDPAEAERIFGALAQNGTVPMPLQETFWAARFGVLVDQYGVSWEVQCGIVASE